MEAKVNAFMTLAPNGCNYRHSSCFSLEEGAHGSHL